MNHLFLDRAEIDLLLDRLRTKKNLILQGERAKKTPTENGWGFIIGGRWFPPEKPSV
jgi:hypothetical protein